MCWYNNTCMYSSNRLIFSHLFLPSFIHYSYIPLKEVQPTKFTQILTNETRFEIKMSNLQCNGKIYTNVFHFQTYGSVMFSLYIKIHFVRIVLESKMVYIVKCIKLYNPTYLLPNSLVLSA